MKSLQSHPAQSSHQGPVEKEAQGEANPAVLLYPPNPQTTQQEAEVEAQQSHSQLCVHTDGLLWTLLSEGGTTEGEDKMARKHSHKLFTVSSHCKEPIVVLKIEKLIFIFDLF